MFLEVLWLFSIMPALNLWGISAEKGKEMENDFKK